MLLTEAMLMALLGIALGVAVGAAFGWAMVDTFIKSAGAGVVSIPFGQIAVYVVAGAAASPPSCPAGVEGIGDHRARGDLMRAL